MSNTKNDVALEIAAKLTLFFNTSPINELEFVEFGSNMHRKNEVTDKWETISVEEKFTKLFGKYKTEYVRQIEGDDFWMIFHFTKPKISIGKICNLEVGWIDKDWSVLQHKKITISTYKGTKVKPTKKFLKETAKKINI